MDRKTELRAILPGICSWAIEEIARRDIEELTKCALPESAFRVRKMSTAEETMLSMRVRFERMIDRVLAEREVK